MGRRRHAGDKDAEAPVNEEQRKALEKIKNLSVQIQKIHEERKRTSPLRRFNNTSSTLNTSTIVSKKTTGTASSRYKKKKNVLYHPNLDYVFAEVTNSPYLTSPGLNYSKETLFTSSKLRKLKVANQGKRLRDIQDTPCDVEKAEQYFMKEIIDYHPRFDMSKNSKGNHVIGVHDPPRPGFIVYPNKYKPLVGHTGKVTHTQPYLLFDPSIKYELPPNSNGILTMKDYKRYLRQLNGKLDAPKQVFQVMKQLSSRSLSVSRDKNKSSDMLDGDGSVQVSIGLASFNQEEEFESTPGRMSGVTGGGGCSSRPSSRPSSARLQPLHGLPSSLDNNRPSTSPSVESTYIPPSASVSALGTQLPSGGIKRNGSSDSHGSQLQRQNSGTFQAHTARAGPEYFLSQKAVQKSYKQFIKTFSKDGRDGEEEDYIAVISRENSFKSSISRNNSFCSRSKSETADDNDNGRISPAPVMKQKKKPRSKRISVSSFGDAEAKITASPRTSVSSNASQQRQEENLEVLKEKTTKPTSSETLKLRVKAESKKNALEMEDNYVDDDKDSSSYKADTGDEGKDRKMEKEMSSKDQPDEMSEFVDDQYECKAEGKSDFITYQKLDKEEKSDEKEESAERLDLRQKSLQVLTSGSKDEDADLSIYQDDDDFESCTSQKIADNDEMQHESGRGGGLMSPLSLDHGEGYRDRESQYPDTEDDQDTHTLDTKEESFRDKHLEDGEHGLELEQEEETGGDGDEDDLSMPLGLDTKSLLFSKKKDEEKAMEKDLVTEEKFEEEEKEKDSEHISDYNDDDFEQEEENRQQEEKRKKEKELQQEEKKKQEEEEEKQLREDQKKKEEEILKQIQEDEKKKEEMQQQQLRQQQEEEMQQQQLRQQEEELKQLQEDHKKKKEDEEKKQEEDAKQQQNEELKQLQEDMKKKKDEEEDARKQQQVEEDMKKKKKDEEDARKQQVAEQKMKEEQNKKEEEEKDSYEEDDFEPLSASNSPVKQKQTPLHPTPTNIAAASSGGAEEDVYDLSDDD